MWRARGTGWMVSASLACASIASAQTPAPVDPEMLDPETVRQANAAEAASAAKAAEAAAQEGDYARSVPRRPITLPDGAFEGGALLGAVRIPQDGFSDSFVVFEAVPHAKLAMRGIELEALLSLDLGEYPFGEDRGAVRWLLGYGAIRYAFSRDFYAGVQLTVGNRGLLVDRTRLVQYAPRGVVSTKLRAGIIAFQFTGVGGVEFLSEGPSNQILVMGGDVRVQAELGPGVVFEPYAGVLVPFLPDGPDAELSFGGSFIFSPTRAFDISIGLATATELWLLVLGVNGRYIP